MRKRKTGSSGIFGSSKLLKDNVVLLIGSLIAAGLNYLFYPIISRFLSPTEFGEVQVLLALTVQTTLLLSLARIVIINSIVNAKSESESKALLELSERVLIEMSLILSVIAILIAPFVAHKFQYASVIPIYTLIPILLTTSLNTSRDSFVRAKSKFHYSSIREIVAAISKVALSTIFVALGLGTVGATLGVLGSSVVSVVVIIFLTKRLGVGFGTSGWFRFGALRSLTKKGAVTKRGVNMVLIAGASLAVTFLSSIDTVISKLSLSPEQAGQYSGISVIANIVFFISGSVAGVLMASVKLANSYHKNLRTLLYSAGLMALLSISVAGVMFVAPDLVIRLMLGEEYLVLAQLLPTVAGAMLCIAGINLLVTYHVALRDRAIVVIAGMILFSILGSLILGGETPQQIASSYLRGNQIAFTICLIWTVIWHWGRFKSEQASVD